MGTKTIKDLIVNYPYEEPSRFWHYERETREFELRDGRRQAGYVRATEGSRAFDDPGVFIPIELPNLIRPRVKAWREAGYPGVTGITKRLLEHWNDPEQRNWPLFFCQLEAIETLIWLVEAPPADRHGIEIPSDGGPFSRFCSKMATGTGKTIVMAMVIAWQVLNKATYPQDKRYSKNVFIVAPGLTVKSRLQVLIPGPGSFYEEFSIVPPGLADKLTHGRVLIHNWHKLDWDSDEQIAKKRSVDKRGAKSDEAYVRDVLGELSRARNIVVINDEAHHAWRVPPKTRIAGVSRDEMEEATKWVGGLDRINKARGILNCFDFTATPFAPTGRASGEETLFGWIVSDFGLNDSIESGLVKTPRVVVRDDAVPDAKTYKSKLYHIYEHVKDDLNRKAQEHEPLPDLVMNAYLLLGKDWLEACEKWAESGRHTPPVMITVANRTETAARINFAFTRKKVKIDELCDPERILHIDSSVLKKAEALDEVPDFATGEEDDDADDDSKTNGQKKLTKKQLGEFLRQQVDTIGQPGKPGEKIHKVISVGMLSEGWDARTVTHIMGLRAFASQLLCEQVVGRGLRRTSYEVNPETRQFDPEYVNIFGVPFTFMPHEGGDGPPPPPPQPKTKIETVPAKAKFEISWPNIVRIDHTYEPHLRLDFYKVKPLELDASESRTLAELAPTLDGKPDVKRISEIDLKELAHKYRMQKVIFETAAGIYEQMNPTWKGRKDVLLAQLIGIVESFLSHGKIAISPPLFNQDDLRRRIVLTLNMSRIIQHIWEEIRFVNTKALVPIFDKAHPIRSTGDMLPWWTGKPCEHNEKSHINLCVYDSTWEASEAFELDKNPNVVAWAKNDHLGLEIHYTSNGAVRKYRPDYLIRLKNGKMLILEVKGQDSQENKTKRAFLGEWIDAVNSTQGFGEWAYDVSFHPGDLRAKLENS